MVIQNKKLRVQNPCRTEDKLCQTDNTLPAVLNSNAKLKSKSALLKYNSKIHCSKLDPQNIMTSFTPLVEK